MEFVEILVPGDAVDHPIHLHGFGFQVIDMGTLKQSQTGKTPFTNATHFPVVKDTVVVPSGGFVRIRFRACHPGKMTADILEFEYNIFIYLKFYLKNCRLWVLHCHFEFHMYGISRPYLFH